MKVASGFIFDIFGRKYTVFISLICVGLSLMLYPLGAPHEKYFILAGCVMNFFKAPLLNNPIVNDYVCKESRGTALSFGFMGWNLANIVSFMILYEYTKDLDPMPQWSIPTGLMIFFAFTCLCLIDEPKSLNTERRKKNYLVQMGELLVQVYKAARRNKKLVLGWILQMFSMGPMVMFDIFLQSWIQGMFARGVIKNQSDVYELYKWQGGIGSIVSLILLMFIGRSIDRVPPRMMLPSVFLLRAINFYIVYFITDPESQIVLFYIIVSLTHITVYIVNISVQSYLTKQYPKDIRGMCMMVQSIFSLIGQTIYL